MQDQSRADERAHQHRGDSHEATSGNRPRSPCDRAVRTFVGAQHLDDDTWVIHNRLEGTFPGSVAELRYRYRITNGLISELGIAP